jgi:hypothetical protein
MNMPFQDNGMVFAGSLPLVIELRAEAPREHELLRANEGNELLLRSVAVLEEKPDHDENDPLAQELKRQDIKLNLILDMIGALLQQQQLLPVPREIQLTGSGLRAAITPNPVSTQHCSIQLYIEPSIPKPLTLFGQCHPSSQAGMTDIVFSGISQGVTDNLEKFIFRHHRRRIAQARKA